MHHELSYSDLIFLQKKVRQKAYRTTNKIVIPLTIFIGLITILLIVTNPSLTTLELKISLSILMLIVVACFSILTYLLIFSYFKDKYI